MSRRQRGLTLLELVIVVAILAAIAAAAVSVTDQVDNQTRYEVTRARAQQIRDAIVGPGGVLNGSPVVQGFVADMGRLPANLAELTGTDLALTNVAGLTASCVPLVYSNGAFDPTNLADYYQLPLFVTNATLATVTTNATIQVWSSTPGAGWRGPYVNADGDGKLRDGWGNVGNATLPVTAVPAADPGTALSADVVDFGWRVLQPGNNLANLAHNNIAGSNFLTNALSSLAPPFSLDSFASPADGNAPVNNFTLASYGSGNQLVAPGSQPWDVNAYVVTLTSDDYLVRVSGWSGTVVLNSSDAARSPISSYYHLGFFYPKVAVPTAAGGSLALTWGCVVSQPLQLVGTLTNGSAQSYSYNFTFAGSVNDVRVPIGAGVLVVWQESANEHPAGGPSFNFGDPVAQQYQSTVAGTASGPLPIAGIFVGNPAYQQAIPVILSPRAALPSSFAWNVRPQ